MMNKMIEECDITVREQPVSTLYVAGDMALECYEDGVALPMFAITIGGMHLRGDSLEVLNDGAACVWRDGKRHGCITRPRFEEWPKALRERLRDHAHITER
jgi:hypothetical protein